MKPLSPFRELSHTQIGDRACMGVRVGGPSPQPVRQVRQAGQRVGVEKCVEPKQTSRASPPRNQIGGMRASPDPIPFRQAMRLIAVLSVKVKTALGGWSSS